ncbi:ABC transporter substrate-binding protein [Paracoccus litorisediminis]|nr:ABC transporter substrate-binding protein [Paracoccus litorisediminis]
MVALRLMVACLAGGLTMVAAAAFADPPRRVVSINLCTDQLALQLAAPGQLVSVSYLAHDPASSAMVTEAAHVPANRGSAEEVFLLQPDLVLAGTFTPPDTLRLLSRLNVPIELFPPETKLQDIRDNLRRMGRVLGREAEAAATIARFDKGLAALGPLETPAPSAAIYAANGYVAGPDSLSGAILQAAGYRNIAGDFGISEGGNILLEQLVIAAPDLLVLGARNPGHARAEELLDHPALHALVARQPHAVIEDHNWSCGTPAALDAIRALRHAAPNGAFGP